MMLTPPNDRPPLDHSRPSSDTAYWRSRTPEERFQHGLYLTRLKYGELFDQPMKKVLEIVYRSDYSSPNDEEDGAKAPSST
jgi:hypothetical protein